MSIFGLVWRWLRDQAKKKVSSFGKLPLSHICYRGKLTRLGSSVCRLLIGDQPRGTAFVLVNNLILTNAHVLEGMFLKESDRVLSVTVKVQFHYKDPRFPPLPFEAKRAVVDMDHKKDYAVLQLEVRPGQTLPPGLLKHFGPKPESGDICIIGHPGGGVKKTDHTLIIKKNKRVESVNLKLLPYDDSTKRSFLNQLDKQNIEQVLTSDHFITYNSFMFHGSSGSPVFDHKCRLVGLHSGGFLYGYQEPRDRSAMEIARPVLEIFKNFAVNVVRRSIVSAEVLKAMAQGNPHVIKILRKTGI